MKKQQGFGLLEILITMVVLGVAVVGLVTFSKSALVASQEGRSYEIAMRLAESKLDEFRNFNSATIAAAPLTAYNDISTNLSGTTLKQFGVDYIITWNAKDQYWNTASLAWQDTPPTGYSAPTSGQKIVTVTVTWQGKQLQLSSNISPGSSLLRSELNGGLDSSRSGPKISFNPGSLPDVVSTYLGDGNNKETSKPTPDIKSDGSVSRLVQFDTVTYNSATNSKKQVQQDSVTVTCSCKNSSQSGFGDTPTKAFYSQTAGAQYWTSGQNVSKSIGGLNVINGKPQENLCDSSNPSISSCCRDHYDAPSMGFSGYYNPLVSGTKPSGIYQDACRFIRIDGFYRPAPDWNLVALNVFSDSFFQGVNGEENLAKYQKYIKDTVIEYAKIQREAFANKCNTTTKDEGWIPPVALSTTSLKTFKNTYTDDVTKFSVSLSSKTKQLISRGLYVDIMSPCYLDTIDFAKESDVLSKVPFQEINMTLLTEWFSLNEAKATVANDAIKTIQDPDLNYYTATYKRGELTLNNTTYNPSTSKDEPVTIKAVSFLGNAGMAGTLGTKITDTGLFESTIQVSINNATPNTVTYEGDIQCLDVEKKTTGGKTTYTIIGCSKNTIDTLKTLVPTIASSNGPATCSVIFPNGNATPKYSCVSEAGTSFTMKLEMNGYVFTYEKPYLSPGLSMPMPINVSDPVPGKCILIRTQGLIDSGIKLSPTIMPTACLQTPPN